MKDREAMKLRVFMIIHNFIMTVVSTVVFLGISISLVRLAIVCFLFSSQKKKKKTLTPFLPFFFSSSPPFSSFIVMCCFQS